RRRRWRGVCGAGCRRSRPRRSCIAGGKKTTTWTRAATWASAREGTMRDDDNRGGGGGRGAKKDDKDKAGGRRTFFRRRRVCKFCVERIDYISYKDIKMLTPFIPERGKIQPRRISG